MPIVSLTGAMAVVVVCILAPSGYTLLSLAGMAPMTVPIFLGWLGWLQLVHVVAALLIWPRRERLTTRMKAALLSWGGLAFWYWLPAPVYFLLTMNIDQHQLQWTALAFFWEVPVVGGAFVLAAQRLYPSRRRLSNDPARRYREVMRYPTLVGSLLFVFTLLGYAIGALQLRLFAALPLVEQVKNVGHGVVISLLLAVFYHLGLDRVLEPVRSHVAREGGLGTVVARTVAGRIFGVSLAVAISGFALISLFVLQAFQAMVAETAATTLTRDLARLAQAADTPRHLGGFPGWGEHGRLLLLRAGETLPAAEFSPETRARVAHGGRDVVHDSHHELKVVGFVEAPRHGGTLVGVIFHTDAYGALRSAARLLAMAGAFVLTVTVGMLVFASRASTQAVRALSSAVRRVEAGEVDDTILRVDTGDEIGELSAVVERYVRRSRDLSENLQDKVRDRTHRLEALQHIDRSILAAESAEAIARAALPRLRQIVPYAWGAVLMFEQDVARVTVTDGNGAPAEGLAIPIGDLPSSSVMQSVGPRYIEDLAEGRSTTVPVFQRLVDGGTRSLIGAPLIASGETIGLLCVASPQPSGFDADHTQIVSEVANQLAVAIHQAHLRAALDRQQARLQAVVQHLPEGVLLLEPDGRVAIANAIGRAYLPGVATLAAGGEVRSVGGLALAQLLDAEVEPKEIVEAGRVFQVAAQPLEQAQGAVLVIRDVTREREGQQVAQRQARLAAVGQLAAGIAHDFNNILMTIVNSADLAQRKYDDTAFGHGRLAIIVEQGERAAALVRQILDFSRQSAPALETVDLAPLLEQTVALLERTLPETIRIVLAPPAGAFVVAADPNQLSQVLTNLAVNARDAMALGGELRFRLGREQRAEADGESVPGPGAWVTLAVSDSGPGMPPEVRERIFEPFFTTKAPGSGTGLGLSQAYGIVTQHRGHIAVESRTGEGTTFTVYLPDEGSDLTVVGAAAGADVAAGRGETLLVVEDEAPVRQSLAHVLTELNYRVLTANCAEQALELHEAHAADVALVLTDLVMPGMGGLRLVRELRERGVQVPVVMMSGYVEESARGGVDGVTAWVQKPVRARRLGAVIQEALSPKVS
ncbi:MAG TPA: ATP-binding protein [Methylomirabilota bacterium]|jgi:signal transduction histidine kinase/HAMP domain-containing protein